MSEPYLCLNGTPLIEGNRTLSYVRKLLPGATVALRSPLIAEPSGQVPENLRCFCAAMEDPARVANTVTYDTPATDPAPWYTAADARSGEFLGFLADIDLGSPLAGFAAPTQRGAATGLVRRQRSVSVSGTAYASSRRGLEYGERWLADVLRARSGQRGDCRAVVLPSCEQAAYRTLERVALVDEPLFAPIPAADGLLAGFSFQLAAGLPDLLVDPVVAYNAALGTGAQVETAMIAGEWLGDLSSRIEVVCTAEGTPNLNVTVSITDVSPGLTDAQVCDEAVVLKPTRFEFGIRNLKAREKVVIDSARREVLWTAQGGEVRDGFERLTQPGGDPFTVPWQWLDVLACGRACLRVTRSLSTATMTLRVETIRRET